MVSNIFLARLIEQLLKKGFETVNTLSHLPPPKRGIVLVMEYLHGPSSF
jgi:hypothetical protein